MPNTLVTEIERKFGLDMRIRNETEMNTTVQWKPEATEEKTLVNLELKEFIIKHKEEIDKLPNEVKAILMNKAKIRPFH